MNQQKFIAGLRKTAHISVPLDDVGILLVSCTKKGGWDTVSNLFIFTGPALYLP